MTTASCATPDPERRETDDDIEHGHDGRGDEALTMGNRRRSPSASKARIPPALQAPLGSAQTWPVRPVSRTIDMHAIIRIIEVITPKRQLPSVER